MRKTLSIFIIFGLWVLVLPRHSYAANLLVDDDKADCPQAKYSKIADAVGASSPGDNIRVCKGLYKGGFIINKANLSLTALGQPGAVKITADSPDNTGIERTLVPKFGITIIANGVHVTGFEISGFAGQHDASGIFVGGTFAGDTANPADSAVIERNNIHDNGNGIYLWQSNNNAVRFNDLHNNKNFDGDEGTGILSFNGFGDAQTSAANAAGRSGKNNIISYNKAHDNDRLGIFAGACTEAAYGCEEREELTGVHADISGTKIQYNDVYGNGKDMTEGIGLLDASGGTVSFNKVHDHLYHGILLNYSDGVKVSYNDSSNNDKSNGGYAGIRISGSKNNNIQYNKTDNNGRGIWVTGSTGDSYSFDSAHKNTRTDLVWDESGSEKFKMNLCGTALPSKKIWDCH